VSRLVALAASLVALAAAGTPAARAASLALTPREQEEAIRVGERSVTSEVFGAEWRVGDDGGPSVTVITPFHRLALAARHAAFKGEPLKPEDRDRMLQELKDRLMLWVSLRGPREDFARHLAPRLLLGEREIQPVMVQNERTAVRQEGGGFLARNVYWFPTKDLTGTSRPTLVVRDPDGQVVARFAIDLGKMR
jgi:hypothetical protein